jgi:hypothetical protein
VWDLRFVQKSRASPRDLFETDISKLNFVAGAMLKADEA